MKLYKATITYRGWAGHFICSDRCLFRLNTLIEHNGESVVVSTVGNMRVDGKLSTIGHRRYYETMAFRGKQNGPYIEVDVDHYVPFESEWQICADKAKDLPVGADNIATSMHSAVVGEIAARADRGESLYGDGEEGARQETTMIISFAKTTPALLARQKTVTRRKWSEQQIALAERNIGKIVQAYDKSPRFGGKHVASIRLLVVERLEDWLERLTPEDRRAEGFDFMPEKEVMGIIREWYFNPSPCVRVEFEVVEVLK